MPRSWLAWLGRQNGVSIAVYFLVSSTVIGKTLSVPLREEPELRFWANEYAYPKQNAHAITSSYIPLLLRFEPDTIEKIIYVPEGQNGTASVLLLRNSTAIFSSDHINVDMYVHNVAWATLMGDRQPSTVAVATFEPSGLTFLGIERTTRRFSVLYRESMLLLSSRAGGHYRPEVPPVGIACSGYDYIAFLDTGHLENAWHEQNRALETRAQPSRPQEASMAAALSRPHLYIIDLATSSNPLTKRDRRVTVRGVYAITGPDLYQTTDGDIGVAETAATLGLASPTKKLTSLQCANETVWVAVRDTLVQTAQAAPRALGNLFGAHVRRLISYTRDPQAWLADPDRSRVSLWTRAFPAFELQQTNGEFIKHQTHVSVPEAGQAGDTSSLQRSRLSVPAYLMSTCVFDNPVPREVGFETHTGYNPLVFGFYSNGLVLGFGCDVTLRRLLPHAEMSRRIKSDERFKRSLLEACQSKELGPVTSFVHMPAELAFRFGSNVEPSGVVCSARHIIGYGYKTDRNRVIVWDVVENSAEVVGPNSTALQHPGGLVDIYNAFEDYWAINQNTAPYWVRGRPFVWPRDRRYHVDTTAAPHHRYSELDAFSIEEEADVSNLSNVGTGIAIGVLISVVLAIVTALLFLCIP